MTWLLTVNDIEVSVTPKDIKHLHLAVYPPNGDVRVSAPLAMDGESIRYYVISKIAWIKKQRDILRAQPREPEREFLNMETHYVWGQPCLLRLHPHAWHNKVELDHDILHMYVKGAAIRNVLNDLLQAWYRQLVADEGGARLEHWRNVFQLPPVELSVRRMKTRWGSCSPLKRKILLNTELARKPRACLDYVAAHELAHFFVPNHGEAFRCFMDKYLPNWKMTRQLLNSLPLGV